MSIDKKKLDKLMGNLRFTVKEMEDANTVADMIAKEEEIIVGYIEANPNRNPFDFVLARIAAMGHLIAITSNKNTVEMYEDTLIHNIRMILRSMRMVMAEKK